jgi:transcriptional regulator of acetoin/glycerol metabolism
MLAGGGIQIEDTKAFEAFDGFRSGRITESEALKILRVSRATFYRRLKEQSN